jgi:hypothetical protein
VTTTSQAAPGWYPDPSDPRQLRWYDGAQWTASVHAAPPTAPQGYQTPTYTQPQYGNQGQQPETGLPSNGCQLCGATPAMKVVLRGNRGMLLVMQRLTYRGQYCRDCGTARFREVQSKTMLLGWWGYFSFVINTYNVFHNMSVERELRGLGAPQGRVRAAKPAGPTVFKTPGFVVTLCLPIVLYLLVTQVWS